MDEREEVITHPNIFSPSDVDCILDAVFIVSPKRQYLGILVPTTPATMGPEIGRELIA